jgi:tetratricopeptide (TPR) repeat protein
MFWLALALAPLPAAIGRALRRDRGRSVRLTAGRRLHALARGGEALPARELRRLFLDALRERVPAVGRDAEPLARVLRRAGVGDTTALEAEALLATLDDAAFSPSGRIDLRTLRESAEIARMVEQEAVPLRNGGAASTLLVCLALTAAAGAALAAAPRDAERSFAEGVGAYERAQFSIAQRRFQLVVQQLPRANDAWANLGASAWQARDSVEASRAWHRSLRLDPLDWESRQRLADVQILGIRSPAYVAPLSSDHVALIVLVLWLGAWLALAVPHARRPAFTRPIAGGAIAVALAGTLLLLELRNRASGRDLAVLSHGRALASAPGADAPSAATARAGEAGRVGARDAGWVHITLDEGRQGWVPSSAIVSLSMAAPVTD